MPLARWTATEEHTLPGVLDEQAGERPGQVCLYVGDEPITYAELRDRSRSAANALADLGAGPGSTVAIFLNTCPEWLYAWLGAARLGAVSVPVNTAYKGEFLANPLRNSGCTIAVVEDTLLDRVVRVGDELPELADVVVHDTGGEAPAGTAWRRHDSSVLLAGDPAKVQTDHEPAWNEPVTILYTSGTTGPSKGAVVTHHYLVASAAAMVDSWRLQPDEVLYAPLPLFHISAVGSVVGPILAGATGLLDPVFSVSECWERVRRYDVAGILLAGVMVNMLWNLPEDPGDAELPLRFMSTAPVPRGLHRPLEQRYDLTVLTSYGMTEAFPMTLYGVDDEAVEGASGRPQPNFEVAILDDEDRPAPPGEVGEICCRPTGPHVMFEGYNGRAEETVERWRNLWFHSGDLGRMDADGNLAYVDRKKDALRRRGENVSSFEVEQTLLRHPAVAEAAAVGVPSDLGEDDVKVCLSLKPDCTLEMGELQDFCVERLPYFAVPRYVEVLDALPKNASGKVVKTQLREAGVTASTWDREQAGYRVGRG